MNRVNPYLRLAPLCPEKSQASSEVGQHRKGFQEPVGDAGEVARQEQHPGQDKQAAHDFFDHAKVLLEAVEEGEEWADGDAGEKEGNTQAQ